MMGHHFLYYSVVKNSAVIDSAIHEDSIGSTSVVLRQLFYKLHKLYAVCFSSAFARMRKVLIRKSAGSRLKPNTATLPGLPVGKIKALPEKLCSIRCR